MTESNGCTEHHEVVLENDNDWQTEVKYSEGTIQYHPIR
jgi:hypothetical protein